MEKRCQKTYAERETESTSGRAKPLHRRSLSIQVSEALLTAENISEDIQVVNHQRRNELKSLKQSPPFGVITLK